MKIAIDFDDTLVCTKEKVREFLNRFHIDSFQDIIEKEKFYRCHIDEITKELKLKRNAKKVLQKLAKKHELYIVTARSDFYSINSKKLVEEYIKQERLPIKEIYFDCFEEGKAEKCVELGIDLFIDDHVNNCLAVQNKGIDALLFENKHDNLKSVSNWNQIKRYVKE